MDTTQYRAMLADAEKEQDRLSKAVQDIDGVVRFCRQRLDELAQQTIPLPFGRVQRGSLAGKSIAEASAEILRGAGRPLRAGEIARSLVAAGWADKKSLPITVTSAIKRRGDLFEKVDRGLFALRNGEP